jgi:tetratricopeptide (TPR) repeat protein
LENNNSGSSANSTSSNQKTLIESLLREGNDAYSLADYEMAKRKYEQVLKIDPRNNAAAIGVTTANEALQQAKIKNEVNSYVQAGNKAELNEDYMTAIAEYKKVLSLSPDNSYALMKMADLQKKLTRKADDARIKGSCSCKTLRKIKLKLLLI